MPELEGLAAQSCYLVRGPALMISNRVEINYGFGVVI